MYAQNSSKVKTRITCLLLPMAWCFIGCALLLAGSAKSCFIVGDSNGDCQITMDDFLFMASQWMAPSPCGSEDGLILHWKLDEITGIVAPDSSDSHYQGSVVGARWNPDGGMLAGALEFDGFDNYVETDPTVFMGVTGSAPRTCTAWIKTNQVSGGIMTWGSLSVDTRGWLIWIDETGVLRVDVGGGHVLGTTVLNNDRWHHVAVTSDGSTTDKVALYVDGKIEPIGEVVTQSVNTSAVTSMKLGEYDSTEKVFEGLIDDVRIYDRVLSMQEIWLLTTTATIHYDCADMNMDGTVNLLDAAKLSQEWNKADPPIIINEFLADNESKSPLEAGEILDGNGESSDWIELYNSSAQAIDIGGWYLTDDDDLKTQWQFPTRTVLQPGEYRLVFASGKTETENPTNFPYVDLAGYLHTNFQLSNNGEYLGLFAADGVSPIHEYNHVDLGDGVYGYPVQEADVSYGYYYGEARYFSVPTPAYDNARSPFEEFVEKPVVNINGGCYANPVDVTMYCDTPGAFIRYTTDGTVPSLTYGLEYMGPIHVDSMTTLFARAFKPGLQPSETRGDTYVFVDPAISPSNTNLPIVVIDTLGQEIPSDKNLKPSIDCRMVVIDTDAVTGRAEITGPEDFEGWGQIRRRGESTYGQGHYAIEIQDEFCLDKEVSLLGMPEESDWILSYDVIDYTMMKNELAFHWFREMGHYAPRQRYVELYLNTDGGAISSADYKGLFMLREKIKRDDNRVNIARLDASHNLEPKVSGGYIIKSDKYNDGDTVLADGPDGIIDPDYLEYTPYGIQVTGVGKPILAEPDPLKVTPPQVNWIAGFLNEVSSVLWQNTSSSYFPGSEPVYSDYLDVTSWIDHGLLEEICCDSDALWGSYYTYKDRGGKICSGPPWDYDRSYHNNGDTYGLPYTLWKTNGSIFGRWHQKMQDDIDYRVMLADRWFGHRENVLNTDNTMAYINQTAALINEARSRPKKYYPNSFETEIALFKEWIINRLNWLDGYIADNFAEKPPLFNPLGGYIGHNDILELDLPSFVSGNIYYTISGEDPRLQGGAISPNAELYPNPGGIVLEFEDFEGGTGNWINITGDTNNWYRTSGTTLTNYTGPDSGADESTWYMYMEASYSSNNGDTVILEGPRVEGVGLKLSFFYHMYGLDMGSLNVDVDEGCDGSWTNGIWSRSGEQQADETSPYTQAIVDLGAYASPLKVRFRGVAAGGSRGDIAIDHVKISEPLGERTTWQLLVNMSSSVWKYLYDGSDQDTAWRTLGFDDSTWGAGPGQLGFGDGDEATDIGPKVNDRRTAYFRHRFHVTDVSAITDLEINLLYDDGAVVYINDQEVGRVHMPAGTINYDTFTQGSGGDNATTMFTGIDPSILVEGDNILAVEVHQDKINSSDVSFDLSLEAAKTYSAFDKSTCVKARILNGGNWSAMNTEVYAVGPVAENLRISEIMYHPTDPTVAEITAVGIPGLTPTDFEYIELQNIGATDLNLNLVHFTDGIDYTFGDYVLPAGQYAVLVKNQDAFAARYNIAGINIVPGVYLGALDNDGEEIVLRDAIGTEIHDFDYNDGWYELTDGQGYSLTMIDPASPDPNLWDSKSGWRSSLYAGGTPGQPPETVLVADSIVINEILSHSHGTDPDWIEFYNTTGSPIDISDWFLTDDDSSDINIRKYEFQAGSIVPAYGYLTVGEDETFGNISAAGCNVPFGLSEGGETVYLYSGFYGSVTGFYQTQQSFDASDTGVTFGRYEKAELSGGYDFVRQSLPTPDAVNSGPLIPDIVITEIYYNPPAGVDYEFVELYNRSGSAVTLQTSVTTETSPGNFVTETIPWRLEGTGYEFPADVTIPAGGRTIVAKNPAMYGGPSSMVYGPYDGKLDNGGEEVEIQMPGDQEYGQDRYWIPTEKIDYDDVAPWPTSADGGGDALQRLNADTYGRDYSNWGAAAPTPGS